MRKGAWLFAFGAMTLVIVAPGISAQARMEAVGEIGGGIFLPTGSDGDIAKPSPALQFVAGIGLFPHFGVEAEVIYVPILLKDQAFPLDDNSRSSQVSVVAGIRATTGRLVEGAPGVGYLSLRAGFARIQTHTVSSLPSGSWIGRTVDAIDNPPLQSPFRGSEKQTGFVLSPKAGVIIRLYHRTAIDLAFQPIFIIDRGKTTTQLLLTLSFAMSAWETF